jgi:aspartyl-tRNA(Asn)/glutamyl-tRNA(Gln) amidotransferase subunit A
MTVSELLDGSPIALGNAVRSGAVSAVEIARATIERITSRDGNLHAFLSTSEAIVDDARVLDERRTRGETLGALAGVPIALKDALATRHAPTTAGSKILEGYVPPYDATVVQRLRAADALFPGKTNMDEFAMGSSTENSAYGPCKNPWDATRTPGGSSGGSAAAVASRMTPAALGSDTGGSIRQPASFTGVVGVKPTYGRVSRYGLVAFASSLDQIGPLASDVRGAARVLDVIAGHDARDATSSRARSADPMTFEASCDREVRGLRIGVPDEYFQGVAPEVDTSVRAALAALETSGCTIERVSLPHTTYAIATYYVIATAEASSNLARYDGVRFGHRAEARDLASLYGKTRDAGFGREVKRRILLGTFVLSAGYYDAYYVKAQKVRILVARDFERTFGAGVDAIACPTSATAAFALGEKTSDPLAMYQSDACTLPASLAGLPAISVPCGPTPSGLPVGLQLIGRRDDEATLFALAAACERTYPPRPAPFGNRA